MKFTLYQVRANRVRAVAFRPYDPERKVCRTDYTDTYNGIVKEGQDESDETALKWLYMIFNVAHPRNFNSYSLSMADIVVLDCYRIYYCDTVGWQRLQTDDVIEGKF